MIRVLFITFWALFSALLTACSPATPPEDASAPADIKAFHFLESESGIEPYPVRMLVSNDFMRMDDGKADDDFLLFNRGSKAIYSVNHADQSVLRIARKALLQELPPDVSLGRIVNKAEDMPTLNGQQAVHLTYGSGVEACYDVVAVEGFEADAVSAMREYLLTLAGEQLQNLNKTPIDMRSNCMMANLIYAPARHLEQGFPLREWDYKGYVRELVDVETIDADPTLFQFNPQYRVYELSASGLPAQTR